MRLWNIVAVYYQFPRVCLWVIFQKNQWQEPFKFLSFEGVKKLVPQLHLNTFISEFDHSQ